MTYDDAFQSNLIEGITKFKGARARAFWQDMFNLIRGKSPDLLSFDDIRTRLRLREESYRGLQDVPLDQIRGSVGRYKDFTSTFLPKTNQMQERWSRVYAQASSLTGLPPIELYKIGDVYFVRDGNHRVSVARQLGSKTIEAHVTELPTSINIHPNMSPEELDGATAYAAFLADTGLELSRPQHQPMNLSERSRYADMMGNIYYHKHLIEQAKRANDDDIRGASDDNTDEITLEQAAADWYDNLYRPAITLIRKHGILDLVPGRTEADLYLWLIDHLRELHDQYGEEAPTRRFSHALVDLLEEEGVEPPEDLKKEEDDSLILSKSAIQKAVKKAQERAADEQQEGSTPDAAQEDAAQEDAAQDAATD